MDYQRYCSLTYNGKLLDELIPEYTTTNVEGRGLFAPILRSTTIEGRDGDYISGQNFSGRDIFVHFVLKADSSRAYNAALSELNLILNVNKDIEFSFGDEEGYRIGRFSGFTNPPFDSHQGAGIINIHCQDPFLHIPVQIIDSKKFIVDVGECVKIKLKEIRFEAVPTNEIRIENHGNGKVISLKNIDSSGVFVLTHDSITLNDVNITSKLDESISTWKMFDIRNGDEIEIIAANSVPQVKLQRLLL